MLSQYKVAVVQAAPVFLNLDATLDKGIALIEEAAGNGARLIGFPETWIPGYPWWIWLDCPIDGLRFVQQYHENSLRKDSPQLQKLCDVARENDILVVMGASERDGGSLYIAQFFIDSDGTLLAVRRKLKPTHVERTVYGDGYGNNLSVYETELGRIGGLCCWEHLQPLSKYAMYAQNEQVHIGAWPTFSLYRGKAYSLGPELNMAVSSVYAAEGQCYFLAPCGVISENMVELMAETPSKQELLPPGGGHAMIFAPDGAPLCNYLEEDEEGLLYAAIDLGAITIAKSFADPAGHYSRPDVTRLLLNTSPVAPVEVLNTAPKREDDTEETDTDADVGAISGLTIVK
jgi:aliphatic nitrilase